MPAGVWQRMVSTVFAADAADVPLLIEKLESSSAYDRRQARSSLADVGLPAVRPSLDRLADDQASYRARLGTIVALTPRETIGQWEQEVGRVAAHVTFYQLLAGFQFTLVLIRLSGLLGLIGMEVDNPVAQLTSRLLDELS